MIDNTARFAAVEEAKRLGLSGVYPAPAHYAANFVAIRNGEDLGSYHAAADAAAAVANTDETAALRREVERVTRQAREATAAIASRDAMILALRQEIARLRGSLHSQSIRRGEHA